jgi:uncharacterized protein YndB with AHSA1/START domain
MVLEETGLVARGRRAQWIEIDAPVGGRYTFTMVNDATGDEVVTGGDYREVVPFERLVFTWGDPDGDPDDTPVVTVTLEPVGERTRMTFDLRGVDGTKGDRSFYDGRTSRPVDRRRSEAPAGGRPVCRVSRGAGAGSRPEPLRG